MSTYQFVLFLSKSVPTCSDEIGIWNKSRFPLKDFIYIVVNPCLKGIGLYNTPPKESFLSSNDSVNQVHYGGRESFMHRKMCIYAHFSVHNGIQTSLIDASAILCWYKLLHFFTFKQHLWNMELCQSNRVVGAERSGRVFINLIIILAI